MNKISEKYIYTGTLEEKIEKYKERNKDWEYIHIDNIAIRIKEPFNDVWEYFLENNLKKRKGVE